MASRKLFDPSTALYQAGRGSEPMIEVGSVTPADALYIRLLSCLPCAERRSEIVGLTLRRRGLEQRAVGGGQRRAGIAEAIDDRIAAVAAEIDRKGVV